MNLLALFMELDFGRAISKKEEFLLYFLVYCFGFVTNLLDEAVDTLIEGAAADILPLEFGLLLEALLLELVGELRLTLLSSF